MMRSLVSTPTSWPPELPKAGKKKVPDYAFDRHTLEGKRNDRTKADIFREEQQG